MISTTIRLDSDIDPVTLGSRSGLLWHDQRVSLAGIGEACRIPVSRPTGGEDAQEALVALAGTDEVQRPGTGPVGFSAMPFDRTAGAELIVPEILIGRGSEGRRWLTLTSSSPATDADVAVALKKVGEVLSRPVPTEPEPTTMELTSVVEPEVWQKIVGRAVSEINEGKLNKVVLAREIRLTTDHAIDPAVVIDHLRRTFATAILFQVDGFLGASPELLAARTGDVVWAHPLAGTAPRGADAAQDAKLAAELLASTKDQWEHRVTISWLLDTLLPFCSYVDAEPEPTIVTLANLFHLGTRVEGRLSSPPASILELVAALHPTPAVGGDPQDTAIQLIQEIEQADRGLYAGPVGWLDGEGNGAFAVGIRSATVGQSNTDTDSTDMGNIYTVFSGVGVVGDSDPLAELAETRTKLQAMLGALIRP